LGQRDRGLAALAEAAIKRNSSIPQLLWNPAFDPLRGDPRFKAALKKMGLPYMPQAAVTR
jgi:hypothetical protein